MNDTLDKPDWVRYLETPVRTGDSMPVKIDTIIAKRLKAFMKAKKARQESNEEPTE